MEISFRKTNCEIPFMHSRNHVLEISFQKSCSENFEKFSLENFQNTYFGIKVHTRQNYHFENLWECMKKLQGWRM